MTNCQGAWRLGHKLREQFEQSPERVPLTRVSGVDASFRGRCEVLFADDETDLKARLPESLLHVTVSVPNDRWIAPMDRI
jgi:hypothetical protein